MMERVIVGGQVCASISRYVERLIRREYRGKIVPAGGEAPVWYRIGLAFTWEE